MEEEQRTRSYQGKAERFLQQRIFVMPIIGATEEENRTTTTNLKAGVNIINLLGPTCLESLCACGWHTVNFLHLVGVSVSAKQLKGYGSEYYL